LTSFYKDLDKMDRQTFIWACGCCLAQDSFIDIIKITTIRIERERLYDDFNKDCTERETGLFQKEQNLQDCKKAIYKKIRTLQSIVKSKDVKIEWLKADLAACRNKNQNLLNNASENRKKACDFDNVKAALELVLNKTN